MSGGAYIVYALKERLDSAFVHYVGLTFTGHMTVDERLAARLEAHWAERNRFTAKGMWLGSLKARPMATVLGLVPTPSAKRRNVVPFAAHDLEVFWIRSLIREGHPLTNGTHVAGRAAAG